MKVTKPIIIFLLTVSIAIGWGGGKIVSSGATAMGGALGSSDFGDIDVWVKVKGRSNETDWIGCSIKDESGNTEHKPAKEISGTETREIWFKFDNCNVAEERNYYTLALWDDYDEYSDNMVGELDRVSWTHVYGTGIMK